MIDKALNHLVKQVNDRIAQLQESLADDVCKDFGEYKKVCGEVKGLLAARSFIKDLQERMEELDE